LIASDIGEIPAEGGAVVEVPIALRADESALSARSQTVHFTLTATDNPALTVGAEAKFLGPIP